MTLPYTASQHRKPTRTLMSQGSPEYAGQQN